MGAWSRFLISLPCMERRPRTISSASGRECVPFMSNRPTTAASTAEGSAGPSATKRHPGKASSSPDRTRLSAGRGDDQRPLRRANTNPPRSERIRIQGLEGHQAPDESRFGDVGDAVGMENPRRMPLGFSTCMTGARTTPDSSAPDTPSSRCRREHPGRTGWKADIERTSRTRQQRRPPAKIPPFCSRSSVG